MAKRVHFKSDKNFTIVFPTGRMDEFVVYERLITLEEESILRDSFSITDGYIMSSEDSIGCWRDGMGVWEEGYVFKGLNKSWPWFKEYFEFRD